MTFNFFDSSSVLEGDCIILEIGRFMVFWAEPDWGWNWRLRFNLADCWISLDLGRLDITFFKGDYA